MITTIDRDGDDGEQDGGALGERERRAGVAADADQQLPAEQLERAPALELGDDPDLGGDVEGEHDDGDEREQRRPPAHGGLTGQRRSSRCLHVTHSVALGKACSRALGMGLPHSSHRP